jgi:hypothetical protein
VHGKLPGSCFISRYCHHWNFVGGLGGTGVWTQNSCKHFTSWTSPVVQPLEFCWWVFFLGFVTFFQCLDQCSLGSTGPHEVLNINTQELWALHQPGLLQTAQKGSNAPWQPGNPFDTRANNLQTNQVSLLLSVLRLLHIPAHFAGIWLLSLRWNLLD